MDSEQILGGSPLGVAVRLVLLSIVVGVAMSALGLSPTDLIRDFEKIIQAIYGMGFAWVDKLFRYFLLGAVVVIPLWLVLRVFGVWRKPDGTTRHRS